MFTAPVSRYDRELCARRLIVLFPSESSFIVGQAEISLFTREMASIVEGLAYLSLSEASALEA